MAELTCQELVELVTAYLDGGLEPDRAELFEQHVAVCSGCETYLQQMEQTASLLGEIPVETLTDEMQATLLETFREFPR
jgi:anti-sigma factor RsiW